MKKIYSSIFFSVFIFTTLIAFDTIPSTTEKSRFGIGLLFSGFGVQWRDSIGSDEFHHVRGSELTPYIYWSIKNMDIGPSISYNWYKSDIIATPPPIIGYGFFARYRFIKRRIQIYDDLMIYYTPFIYTLSLWKSGYLANNNLEEYNEAPINATLIGTGLSFKIWKWFHANLAITYPFQYYYDTKQLNFKNRLYGTFQLDFRF